MGTVHRMSSEPHRIWAPPIPSPVELLAGASAGAAGQAAAPLVRAAVHAGMREMFRGDDDAASTPEPDVAPGDAGWFGPDSVTWRIHADTSMFVAGIAALTLQALHPLAMAGVSDHSDFAVDPLGRLRRTAGFLGTTAYGTTAEADEACAVVRHIHRSVRGHAPDGRPYSADDPELLDWVHVTETATFAAAHRRYGSDPTSDAELDRYIDEMARVAVELGDPDPPRSWEELDAHLERHRPVLAIGAQARQAMRFLESPPLPAPVRALWPILFRGAMACVPPWATELWGIERPSVAERAACRATVRALGAVLGTPPGVAHATARVRAGEAPTDSAA